MRRLTNEEFRKQAIAVHGDRYDYSDSEYRGSKVKVKIGCKKPGHGFFYQAPSNHVSVGQGCPTCAGKIPWTMEKFIAEARSVHGDRFSYDHVLNQSYNGQKGANLALACPEHGKFACSAYDHLRYQHGGCQRCADEQRRKTRRLSGKQKFLDWFKKHRGKTLKLVSSYQGMTKPIEVECIAHGEKVSTIPTYLTSNDFSGCYSCGVEERSRRNRLTIEEIHRRHEDDLPDHVQIAGIRFDSERRHSMVTIRCEHHGLVEMLHTTFKQSKYKCSKCGNDAAGYAGYRLKSLLEKGEEGRPTWIAVMEVEVFGIRSLKVGITSRTIEERYTHYLKKIFFSVKLREIDALVLENRIRLKFSTERDNHILGAGLRSGSRWSGDTECYQFDARPAIESYIQSFIHDLEESQPDYWAECDSFELPDFSKRRRNREKCDKNQPVPVVCVETGERFPSVSEAQRVKNVHGISMVVLREERQTAGGYRWVTAEAFDAGDIPELKPKNIWNTKPVVCVSTGKTFSSVSEAEQRTGVRHISQAVNGKRHTAGGYQWATLEDYQNGNVKKLPQDVGVRQPRKIRCTETGVEYPSIMEAKRATGISNISAVLGGRRTTAGGRHWQYVNSVVSKRDSS